MSRRADDPAQLDFLVEQVFPVNFCHETDMAANQRDVAFAAERASYVECAVADGEAGSWKRRESAVRGCGSLRHVPWVNNRQSRIFFAVQYCSRLFEWAPGGV